MRADTRSADIGPGRAVAVGFSSYVVREGLEGAGPGVSRGKGARLMAKQRPKRKQRPERAAGRRPRPEVPAGQGCAACAFYGEDPPPSAACAGGEAERQLSDDEQLVMAITSKILEGEASQDEVDQLEAITRSDEKLRKSHQEVVDIDRMLRQHCQEGTFPSGE